MNTERRRKAAEQYDVTATKECAECGTTFTSGKYAAKSGPKIPKFCSMVCAQRVAQRAFYQRGTRKGNPRLGAAVWHVAREKAIERDNGLCRICHAEGKHVHHLFHRTEEEMHDHSQENLVTLCNSCHSKVHDIKIGRVNGEVVLSGIVFELLNLTTVKVIP
jgi:5-methylcytosine-specific restriction endonuclease McrA